MNVSPLDRLIGEPDLLSLSGQTVCHYETLPSDAKLWPEGQIFRSVGLPHTHDRFFFLAHLCVKIKFTLK